MLRLGNCHPPEFRRTSCAFGKGYPPAARVSRIPFRRRNRKETEFRLTGEDPSKPPISGSRWPSPIGASLEMASGVPLISTCENQINIKSKSNYTIVLWPFSALFLALMRTAIDDLPCVSASRMRAAGLIRPDDTTATVAFPAGEFTVGLQHVRFPNRGGWSFFICACGRRCRTLRLYRRPRLQGLSGGPGPALSGRGSAQARACGSCGVAAEAPPQHRPACSAQAAFALQQAGASLAA